MREKQFLKVAAIQMDIIWENKRENFLKLDKLFEGLNGVDLVILPETFATGFTMKSEKFSESSCGETEEFLLQWAEKLDALLVGGWIESNPNGNPFNTVSLVNPSGEISRYRKIHPFSYGGEDKTFSSGNKIIQVEWNGFKITPFICYDLRFPEIFRRVVGNTDLFIIPANWPSPRIHHWLTLLKARALENQAYVVGVNRVGVAGTIRKLYHNGYSGLFHPFGGDTILGSEREEVLVFSLDLDELKKVREEFPYLKDIRGTGINFE